MAAVSDCTPIASPEWPDELRSEEWAKIYLRIAESTNTEVAVPACLNHPCPLVNEAAERRNLVTAFRLGNSLFDTGYPLHCLRAVAAEHRNKVLNASFNTAVKLADRGIWRPSK